MSKYFLGNEKKMVDYQPSFLVDKKRGIHISKDIHSHYSVVNYFLLKCGIMKLFVEYFRTKSKGGI
ncbi:hypothetical protein DCE79_13420 [Lysinibacillus sp. 2017]|nr:hypothetical protein DCE79_13420 [Lysinibacillus sp. 2017]